MKKRLIWLAVGALISLYLTVGSALAYNVTGTIQNNTGNNIKRVYIDLMPANGSSSTSFGTSIASIPNGGSASYTIRGVPSGQYQVAAFMDMNNTGSLHINDPANATANFTMTGDYNISTPLTLSAISSPRPTAAVSGINVATTTNGALVAWTGPKIPYAGSDGPDAERADSYMIYWGTSPNPGNGSPALGTPIPVPAAGGDYHVFIPNLASSPLYFTVKATNNAGNSYASTGPVTIAAGTGGATVTGRVYYSGTSTSPLYIVLQGSNGGFYIGGVTSNFPANTANWSITGVQPDTYTVYAILDLKNDGFSSPSGYITGPGMNTSGASPFFTVPTGASAASAPDITLTAPNCEIAVNTQNGNNTMYQLQFRVASGLKQPVSVTVNDPKLSSVIDVGLTLGRDKGASFGDNSPQVSLSTAPLVGDTYSVIVGYTDGSSETLYPKITGVVTDFPSSIFPQGSTSPITSSSLLAWTTPAPLLPGYYDYSVYVSDASYNQIWAPQNSSNGNMPATQLTIPYNGPSLSTGNSYNWSISVTDGFGNSGWGQGGTFIPQSGGPNVSDFFPAAGVTGTAVTIYGNNFTGATAVTFGGVSATTFTVNSSTQITATVPSNAPVGPITVTAGGVTGASTSPFQATVSFTGGVTTFGNPGTPINNATVTVVNSNPVNFTTTNSSGSFTIAVPSGVPFSLLIHDGVHHDTLTPIMEFTSDYAAAISYTLYADGNISPFSVASKGLIYARVRDWDTDVPIQGATVTATSFLHPDTPYPVSYTSGTATASDGKFFVPNVDEGDIVSVTASLTGKFVLPTTYVTHTGVVSSGKVNATLLTTVNASPSGGSIPSSQQITLTASNTVGADTYNIYYTTDGSDPTTSSSAQLYSGPFTLNVGTVTLRFYARNMSHNIAGSIGSATYNVYSPQYSLNVTVNGFGQVTGIAASQQVISCATGNTGTCSWSFDPGAQVQLTAVSSGDAYFSNWSNCDIPSGNGCTVTMNSQKDVSATFTATVRVNYTTDKPTIQQAFTDALTGDLIQTQAYDFNESSLNLSTPVTLKLMGGYDSLYNSNPAGYSILHGILTIFNGSLTIDRFVIQ